MKPWHAEWTLTDEDAAARIGFLQPSLAGQPVVCVGHGWDNTLFRVGAFVFRFPRRSVALELLRTEVQVLPALAPFLPVPIPVPLDFWEDDGQGRPVAQVPYLVGETACRVAPARLDSAALAEDLGAAVGALHRIPRTGVLRQSLPEDSIDRLNREMRLAQLAQEGPLMGRLLGSQWPDVLSLLNELAKVALPTRRCVVHGDLYARHVLVDETNRLAGWIDWGDVHWGCPALDFAVAWLVLPSQHRQRFFDAVDANRCWQEPEAQRELSFARWRALYHACRTLAFADDTEDTHLLAASYRGISAVLADSA